MKVHKITTKNFLALRDCTIDGLDERLNFFVGPNGSGKSSLFRALKVLKESFEAVGTVKTLDHLYSVHASPRQLDIDVKVSWDTDHEQKAIGAFLYASLSATNSLHEAIKRVPQLSTYQITPERSERFTTWLREQCTPGRLQFLFTGQLHLTYREETGTRLSYTFACRGELVTIQMAAYPPQDGTFWKGSVPISSTTTWTGFQPKDEEGACRLEHHGRGIIGMVSVHLEDRRFFTGVPPSERHQVCVRIPWRETRAPCWSSFSTNGLARRWNSLTRQ